MASSDSTPDPIKSTQASNAIRDLSGKFSKVDPPFISFSITNPVTYIRKWWKGVMDGEGVDLRLKIHPFTAVMIVLAVGGVSFGVGRISIPEPVLKYVPILSSPLPSPTPNPWQERAFVGTLQKQGTQFFLVGNESLALKLEIPSSISLEKYVGRKILASGKYNAQTSTLQILIASDLELISGSQPVPTLIPTPQATSSAEPLSTE